MEDLQQHVDSELWHEFNKEAAYQFAIMDFAAIVREFGLNKCLTDLMAMINEDRIGNH